MLVIPLFILYHINLFGKNLLLLDFPIKKIQIKYPRNLFPIFIFCRKLYYLLNEKECIVQIHSPVNITH